VTLNDVQQFIAEAYLLASLQHKNILRVVGVVSGSLPMLVVTQLMLNNDLKTFLRASRPTMQNRKENLGANDLMRIGSLAVEACEFLEECKVVHRALMAANVFVGADHRDIRLAGLDSLRETGGEEYEYVKTSSIKDQLDIRWLAPESFDGNRFTVKSDVWSFGVLLWEITSYARTPFGTYSAFEIAAEVRAGKRLQRPHGCPDALFACMRQCWFNCPSDRPTFAKMRGAINMLLLDDAESLREKVAAATHIRPILKSRWEVQTTSLEIMAADESGGDLLVQDQTMKFGKLPGLSSVRLPGPPARLVLAATASTTEEALLLRRRFNAVRELRHSHVVEILGCSSAVGFTILYHRPSLGPLSALLPLHPSAQLPSPPAASACKSTAATALSSSLVPAHERAKVVLHIALGLEYLHANNFVHGCLSPHMVYVDGRYNARVVAHVVQSTPHNAAVFAPTAAPASPPRLGYHSFGGGNQVDGESGGSFRWQAPEAIVAQPITFASDVFAFGMVLWSLYETGCAVPYYPLLSTNQALREFVRSGTHLERHAAQPSRRRIPATPTVLFGADVAEGTVAGLADFRAVFEACTTTNSKDRPGMAGVATLLLEVVEGDDRWEVDRRALKMVEKLGEGHFGDVSKMATPQFSADGSLDFVAVKMLKTGSLAGSTVPTETRARAEAEFLAEIELMKRLRHPNLVTLLGICTRKRPFLALIEFLKGGSLDKWLPENGHKLLKPLPTKLISMLHQVALGCQALARSGIVHRDLAARNILVDDRLHVKVADYGLSREVDEGRDYYRTATKRLMPLRWMAPEALTLLKWTSAADCYSFGIVAVELFTLGGFPFELVPRDKDLIAILTGSAPIHRLLLRQVEAALARHNAPVPPLVVELVQRCTVRDPLVRPKFAELVQLTTSSPAVLTLDGGRNKRDTGSQDSRL
jgi:serine/threonine protein kinase